jgi:hypothetical protein
MPKATAAAAAHAICDRDSDFDGRRVNTLPKKAHPTADEQPLAKTLRLPI